MRNTQQNTYTELSLLENLAHSSHIKEIVLKAPLTLDYD